MAPKIRRVFDWRHINRNSPRDGGFAEYAAADERFCFALPERYVHAAPQLCAGLIGFRACAWQKKPRRLGLYGFGASVHILCQITVAQGQQVYAFTRPDDRAGQDFARRLDASCKGATVVCTGCLRKINPRLKRADYIEIQVRGYHVDCGALQGRKPHENSSH